MYSFYNLRRIMAHKINIRELTIENDIMLKGLYTTYTVLKMCVK